MDTRADIRKPVRLATCAMGTRFEFVLLGDDDRLLQAAGEEAIHAIEDTHRRLSRFEPGGPIYEINAQAGEAAVRVDDEIFELLERCSNVRTESSQAFDVVRRAAETRLRADPALNMDKTQRTIGLVSAGTMIDLGGVAKGFALDLAAEILRDSGITSAFLHGGTSTAIAVGHPPGADAWAVSLGCDTETKTHRGIAMLADTAMSVSSQDGDRPGHVINPATGTPASNARWAACIGASAEATDAWSTALIVRGTRPCAMPDGLTSVVEINDSQDSRTCAAIGPEKSCIVSAVGCNPPDHQVSICSGVHL